MAKLRTTSLGMAQYPYGGVFGGHRLPACWSHARSASLDEAEVRDVHSVEAPLVWCELVAEHEEIEFREKCSREVTDPQLIDHRTE
jgi:hypothetical protein